MRTDLEALKAGGRVDGFRAMAISNYVRALAGVSKTRNSPTIGGKLGKTSMADLIEQAMLVPEFRDALKGMG